MIVSNHHKDNIWIYLFAAMAVGAILYMLLK